MSVNARLRALEKRTDLTGPAWGVSELEIPNDPERELELLRAHLAELKGGDRKGTLELIKIVEKEVRA